MEKGGHITSSDVFKILIVDDDEFSRELLSATLDRVSQAVFDLIPNGFSIDIAGDGISAIAMAVEQKYNLIFMDLNMPGIDGLTTTEDLSLLIDAENMPTVIGLSATKNTYTIQRAMDSGMKEFIIKPVRLEHLRTMIENILNDIK